MQDSFYDNYVEIQKSEVGFQKNLKVHLRAPRTERLSALAESIKTAQLIKEKAGNRDIIIPLSGGVDSEAMARVFRMANIPHKILMVKYKNNFNHFELQYAEDFSSLYSERDIIKLDLDLDGFFFSQRYLDYAVTYECRSPQLCVHLWMLDQIDGFFVFSYNPLPLFIHDSDRFEFIFPDYLYFCYDRFFKKNNTSGISFFFLYTSEIAYSFILSDIHKNFIMDSAAAQGLSTDPYFVKTELYRRAGIPIQAREFKATGFEHYRAYLNKKFNFHDRDFFDQVFRLRAEEAAKDIRGNFSVKVDLKYIFDAWSQK